MLLTCLDTDCFRCFWSRRKCSRQDWSLPGLENMSTWLKKRRWTISKDGETVEKKVSQTFKISFHAKTECDKHVSEVCYFFISVTLIRFQDDSGILRWKWELYFQDMIHFTFQLSSLPMTVTYMWTWSQM